MRSRRYKTSNDISCLSYEKAGSHGICEYGMKGKYNSISFYKNKHLDWWNSITRWVDVLYIDYNTKYGLSMELRRIRCGKKYKM